LVIDILGESNSIPLSPMIRFPYLRLKRKYFFKEIKEIKDETEKE
jgi:hypothetical protein